MKPATMQAAAYFPLPLQISAHAWQHYALTLELIRPLPAAPLYPLRRLADHLQRRTPGHPATTGQLNLLGLLNTACRHVTAAYLQQRNCRIGLAGSEIGASWHPLPSLPLVLESFIRFYPPAAVLQGQPPETFLREQENRQRTAVELFLLATQAGNPAADPLKDLFDDADLQRSCGYRETVAALDRDLGQEAVSGLLGGSLLRLLRAPMEADPHSLAGQLDYVRRHWSALLPEELLGAILTAFDVLQEEEQLRGMGPGVVTAPHFGAGPEEAEAFSADADWMANVVLIAKSVYVWLHQLSRQYGRTIERLDQIPDAELDRLARWGISGLWLIGLWERSPASQKIKRIMGNPEAVSSAYSLYDYVPAAELGGEAAVTHLQQRCEQRGIRLGCDVVPNHTGIYSRWTQEHPDWFIQLDYPPYPAYRFTGPDLSFDDAQTIQIEDGYWNHSDAAVVFRHQDHRSGQVRYIYHGNDGTHMPWNDTAQLNFLLPQVREAMIRTILHVARQFKIIRFDAAMTLAKKHYQRLWFPQPGGGAGVPSRAEHALSREEFDRLFPQEFWREVVDRVAAEVPDTLLLAEAFWLMEGYFVRTLGMHRVYNSAFMNMLKQEENGKYRGVLKEILGFNHEILKRFVNFMNNPDEATAVEQFGMGDKYFGVAILLVTLPGLPMLGHGQIEGYREKYGMEYRRAYWDETPDEGFVRYHEKLLFPLLHRRSMFSQSHNFNLFDFYAGGQVNEDVFAYSNRCGEERSLVVYHNRYGDTGGWIRQSVPKAVRGADGEMRPLTTTLAETLGVAAAPGWFCRFRDHCSESEYLLPGAELAGQGLHVQLGPYQARVFLDFRMVQDVDGRWAELHRRLQGGPTDSLDRELRRLRLEPLSNAFTHLLHPERLRALADALSLPPTRLQKAAPYSAFTEALTAFLRTFHHYAAPVSDLPEQLEQILTEILDLHRLLRLKTRLKTERLALILLREGMPGAAAPASVRQEQFLTVFLPYLCLHRLGPPEGAAGPVADAWLEEYLLLETLGQGVSAENALLVKILTAQRAEELFAAGKEGWLRLFEEPEVVRFLGVHEAEGYRWFVRERFQDLAFWLYCAAATSLAGRLRGEPTALLRRLASLYDRLQDVLAQGTTSAYRFERLLELFKAQA